MAKFFGSIGFGITEETSDGIASLKIIERKYIGDVYKVSSKYSKGETLNDNLDLNNEFSILADPYAKTNFNTIRYVEWYGTKWKVTNVTVDYPRLRLTVGGVWND